MGMGSHEPNPSLIRSPKDGEGEKRERSGKEQKAPTRSPSFSMIQ